MPLYDGQHYDGQLCKTDTSKTVISKADTFLRQTPLIDGHPSKIDTSLRCQHPFKSDGTLKLSPL